MSKQIPNTGRNWYVLHTYSGYEDAVAEAIKHRIETMNMQNLIFDVVVPKEVQITVKKGKPIQEKKRIFPGYVIIEMIVTDDSWYMVRNTPNVTGFVGSGNIPVPVKPEEWHVVKKRMGVSEPKFKIDFKIGDLVTITDGPFKNYEGSINKIDEEKGKIQILVNLFERETPVELDFTQIKKK